MNVLACKNWKDFHSRFIFPYVKKSRERRSNLLFRGQLDSNWQLQTTLDRAYPAFDNDLERANTYDLLLEDFRREALTLGMPDLPQGPSLELLARHHGVPSPFLDWTTSPYVAAYFALGVPSALEQGDAAIWVFDRARYVFGESGIEYIDDIDLIRSNLRAIRQRGVFMRVRTARAGPEDLLATALTKITIPRTNVDVARTHLDEMLITSTVLFTDLDGAALTVRSRHAPSGRG